MDDINESDCCGNGCANCVLNTKPTKSLKIDKSGKHNVLEKYTKFLLINKTLHMPQVEEVWELHFKSKHCNNKEFIMDIDAGYHIMMRKVIADMEKTQSEQNKDEKERKYLLRPYSPFWWNETEMEFKVLIDLKPNGPMSKYIKDLAINDEIEFRGPVGKFDHQIDQTGNKYMLIISQGVAIASVIPIIQQVLNNEDDITRIVHIACFQDLNHVYFRDKLYKFAKYWNYKIHMYLSKEVCNNTDCIQNLSCLENCHNFNSKLKYKETIKPFRFTKGELIKIIVNLGHVKENNTLTISGNGKFQSYFKELCQTVHCGFSDNNIYLL